MSVARESISCHRMSGGQKGLAVVTVCQVARKVQQLSQYVRWPEGSSSCHSISGGQKGLAVVTFCQVARWFMMYS
jgi:hypothetical protein